MMFDDFLKSNWCSSWIINGSIEWQFLDEYTFFKDSSTKMNAIGIIIKGETIYTASISIIQNQNGKYDRAIISYDFKDTNIESIQMKKLDRLGANRRDF